jgi:tetratricopeptide (TPR) repeat protein
MQLQSYDRGQLQFVSDSAEQLSSTPTTPTKYSAFVTTLATLGDEKLKEGDVETARLTFQLALRIDPGNERATLSLCDLCEDCYEARDLLNVMLQYHPNNSVGIRLLREAEARYIALEELEDMVRGSNYLKSWEEREKKHDDLVRFSQDRRVAPITKIGRLMLNMGYVTEEQLNTAVSLQEMLARFEDKQPLGKILLDYDYITQAQLDEALRMQEIEFRSQMY